MNIGRKVCIEAKDSDLDKVKHLVSLCAKNLII